MSRFGLALVSNTLLVCCLSGCLEPLPTPPPSDGDGTTPDPTGECQAKSQAHPILEAYHVLPGTYIQYNSNPPSSGLHYGSWAAFKTASQPVPRGYYVHNLEHGAIVFLYQGDASAKAALERVAAQIPDDLVCSGFHARVRVVITEDKDIDTPIAAAAWGYTYTANCVDEASLLKFALDHYAKAPENLCVDGIEF